MDDDAPLNQLPDLPTDQATPTPLPPPLPQPDRPNSNSRAKKMIILVSCLLLLVIAGALVAWYHNSSSQSEASVKVYKVGILDGIASYFGGTTTGFEQGMTKLGYVQGKNITYDVQNPKNLTGNGDIFRSFIKDKDNLIVVFPTEPTQEAEKFTAGSNIPILALNASFEGTNLIDNVQHPGHDLVGVRFPAPEDSVERLDVLHQLAPAATRILVPYLAGYPNVPGQLGPLQTEAKTLGLILTVAPFATPADVSTFVAGLSTTNPSFDAIVLMAEPFSTSPALNGPLFEFADLHDLPIVGGALSDNDTGPIASVAPDANAVGELGAPLADKVFKGAQAGSLPILTATSNLEVNLKVSQRLGITPDPGLLSTATEIIR